MANNLYELRKKRGLTLKDVATTLGVSVTAISQYESEQRGMDKQTLFNFANFYGVTIDCILGREEINANGTNVINSVAGGDEMERNLLAMFRELSFNDKLKVFNFLNNMEK